MPVSFEDVINKFNAIDQGWIDRAIKEIDEKLGNPSWVRDWKCGNIDTPYWRIVVKGNVNSVTKDELIRRYEQVGWKGTRVINSHEQGEVSGAVEVTFFGYDY